MGVQKVSKTEAKSVKEGSSSHPPSLMGLLGRPGGPREHFLLIMVAFPKDSGVTWGCFFKDWRYNVFVNFLDFDVIWEVSFVRTFKRAHLLTFFTQSPGWHFGVPFCRACVEPGNPKFCRRGPNHPQGFHGVAQELSK